MDFDDVVIGSGMAALGAVLGLAPGRRVLVLTGPVQGQYAYYDSRNTVPCAYLGEGGLGNDWHGVIPTGLQENFGTTSEADFSSLFARFYPHSDIRPRLGQAWIFVPWRAIRPKMELTRLAQQRAGRLVLRPELAQAFRVNDSGVQVSSASGQVRTRRVWVAAGALHTPGLLERSLNQRLSRGLVSDHVLCYIGQVAGRQAPQIIRTRDGMFISAEYGPNNCGLYTRRPARFKFKQLDHGIEQRAVFGLPTGNAIKKVMRRMSPGLLAEAFYNRFGLFPQAPLYSVYAQVHTKDAYVLGDGRTPLKAQTQAIRVATDHARQAQPFDQLLHSQRPEIFIPGIHLHHSLDLPALTEAGVNTVDSSVQVIDASVLSEIGPDHHTFQMLLAARMKAQQLGN